MLLNITFLDTSKDWIIVSPVRERERKLVLRQVWFPPSSLINFSSSFMTHDLLIAIFWQQMKLSHLILEKKSLQFSWKSSWKKTLSKMDITFNCHRPSLFFLLLTSEVIMTREVEMCPNHSPDSWWQWRRHYRQEIGKKRNEKTGKNESVENSRLQRNTSLPDKLAWRFWSRRAYSEFLMLLLLLFVSLFFSGLSSILMISGLMLFVSSLLLSCC